MSDKKEQDNVWFLHHYATPPNMSGLTRPFYFSKHLLESGFNCTVFASSFLHYSGKNLIEDKSKYKEINNSSVQFVFIKTGAYKASKILRVKNMLDYYVRIFKIAKEYSKKNGKPKAIIGSSAHPLAAIAAIKLGKKLGCPAIVEVRDLWPESFVEYGVIGRKNPITRILYAGEKWIYKKADKLIFTMEGGKDYIIEQGWDKDQGGPIDLNKVHYINNGVDLEVFNYNKKHYCFEDKDLDDTNTFKVVYAGSIRLVNNVKTIIDAAWEVKKLGDEDIKFLIYGEGNDRISLEQYCMDNHIDNVIFKGYVDKKFIPYILSKSDLNIIHFEQNKLKKYGASLNKMFEYFASGKPTFSDCKFGYDLISFYECGIVIDNADAEEMAKGITIIRKMSFSNYERLCKNSLKAAKDFDFKNLSENLIQLINGGNRS